MNENDLLDVMEFYCNILVKFTVCNQTKTEKHFIRQFTWNYVDTILVVQFKFILGANNGVALCSVKSS